MGIIASHFQQKWCSHQLDTSDYPEFSADQMLTEEQRTNLTLPVLESEVRAVVFSLGRGHSPSIDGITGTFYQGFWQSVGSDVCEAVMQFFKTCVMPERWKQTLVILIPKKDHSHKPSDFRPISLCTTVYKVVAKILVARLKPILPLIISQEQGAFVPGRLISDNVLLAQEAINRLRTHTSPHGSMALKIDMEQAYDRMEWRCLLLTMQRMGFPDRWIEWVMACIDKPTFSIMINGERTHWITAGCGFRQGYPLSPFLFILCSELLSKAFKVYAELLNPLGIRCSPNGPLISHLLYVDDILVVAKVEDLSCNRILKIFADYGRWTGQVINKNKSNVMFSKKVPNWMACRLANKLGFQKASELSYLGVPLKLSSLAAKDFDCMLQYINNKLHSWGVRQLSLAGRITLLNSVLMMGTVYKLSHCIIPRSVIQLIEKTARTFLWHGNDNSRMHYVAWNNVCRPRDVGGLGVHRLLLWRSVLLARHAFRFINTGNYLLKDCLTARYGRRLDTTVFKRADSSAWRLLCWGYKALTMALVWEVGDGNDISFYSDKWINGRSLDSWPTFLNYSADFLDMVANFIMTDW